MRHLEAHPRYLEIHHPGGGVSQFALDSDTSKSPILLGRGEQAGLRLEDGQVSREHAELAVDELGRWSVRDLRSRHGTYLNGERLGDDYESEHWELVEPGDSLQVCGFTLVLMVGTPALDWAMGYEPSFVNEQGAEPAGQQFHTLKGVGSVPIRAAQLAAMGNLGMQLVQTSGTKRRVGALCRRLIQEDMHGLAATVLHLRKDDPARSVHGMMRPVLSGAWPKEQEIYISRSVVGAVLQSGEGVLAGASGSGAGGEQAVELSITPDHPSGGMGVIAVPLQQNRKQMNLLYLVVPPQYATPEWLALVSLAAKQFEIAQTASDLQPQQASEEKPASA